MRSISLLIFLFIISSSCSAQKDVIDRIYEYSYSEEPTVLDNAIHFKNDSILSIGGGEGQYKYWSYWKYKALNDSIYYITPRKPLDKNYIKEVMSDTIKLKVQMLDVKNDTIYWKNDKEFIFRERLFKLFEYKGIPLEDQ